MAILFKLKQRGRPLNPRLETFAPAVGSLVLLVAMSAGMVLAPSATAAPTVTGTWSCCGSGGASAQTWVINESGGSLSGTGYNQSNAPFTPISGSNSGGSVTIVTGPYDSLPSYTATFVGTIAGGGETMSGTWSSNGGQEGTWSATRTSGSGETEAEKVIKKEKEEAANKRKAAIQVNCDAFDPGLPTEYLQCTAQLGDASGRSPAQRPTGTVSFVINPGGKGGFRGSSSCVLAPSQTGGASSFCAITYIPPPGGLPIGSQPPITANYSGDGTFSPISGAPSGPLARQALTEKDVFEALCGNSYFLGCEGHFPAPPALTGVCVSFPGSARAASEADSTECGKPESAPETLTLDEDVGSVVADADCPITEGPLTDCEIETIWKGNAPPELVAKKEYYEKLNVYMREVDKNKGEALESVSGTFHMQINGHSYAWEELLPAKERQEAREKGQAELLLIEKRARAYFDELGKPGVAVPDASGPRFNVDVACADANPLKIYPNAIHECEFIYGAVNEVLKTTYEKLASKKEQAGLNAPFKLPTKKASASVSEANRHVGKHPAKYAPRYTLLAASPRVSVRAGKTAKIRLKLPSYVQADLRGLRARGVHTLRSDFVVRISRRTIGTYTRTIPVQIKLAGRKTGHGKHGSKKHG